jgi:hypothetical protein
MAKAGAQLFYVALAPLYLRPMAPLSEVSRLEEASLGSSGEKRNYIAG